MNFPLSSDGKLPHILLTRPTIQSTTYLNSNHEQRLNEKVEGKSNSEPEEDSEDVSDQKDAWHVDRKAAD